MKTADFIKKTEALGLIVTENVRDSVVVMNGYDVCAWADTKKMYIADTDFAGFRDLDETIQKIVFAQNTEYAVTPIDEREGESLYTIQLPMPRSGNEARFIYIGYDRQKNLTYSISGLNKNQSFKYKFTEKEVKAIDERYWAFAKLVKGENKC